MDRPPAFGTFCAHGPKKSVPQPRHQQTAAATIPATQMARATASHHLQRLSCPLAVLNVHADNHASASTTASANTITAASVSVPADAATPRTNAAVSKASVPIAEQERRRCGFVRSMTDLK
jgi:hypothetical protein